MRIIQNGLTYDMVVLAKNDGTPLNSDAFDAVGVLKIEERFNFSTFTADTLVKGGPGFVHTVTLSPNGAAVVAGKLIIYNNTVASGPIIFQTWLTTAFAVPVTVLLDVVAGTAIHAEFDATLTGVSVTVAYR